MVKIDKSYTTIMINDFKDIDELETLYFLIKDMLEDNHANANRP
jgi:hypothetical protein